MKKLLFALVTSACTLGFAPASQAAGPWCEHFVFFCDALELTVNDDRSIVGTWVNWDCAGSTASVKGEISGAKVSRVSCTGSDCPNGWDFIFVNSAPDGNDGIFDLYGNDGFSNIRFQNDSPYMVTNGACNLADGAGLPPSFSVR